MKKPELVAPAGDWIMLKAAIDAGADAVYFGVKGINMRAAAENFRASELKKVVNLCHKNKIRAYLAMNTIIYESELDKIKFTLKKAKQAGIDAVICWDFAVISEARKLKLPIHLSTQASVSNSEAAEQYRKLGIKRVVLARECSLAQIKQIKARSKLEIEVFVHGAMCISISGRCFLSHYLFGKSANRGECLQPCRRKYRLFEPEDSYSLILGEDYLLSPKDLCTITFIDKLIKAGIDSFKIEGRKRSPEYISEVTRAYRMAIDLYYKNKLTSKAKQGLLSELKKVYNRGFSGGFYFSKPSGKDFVDVHGSKATERKVYTGRIINFYNKPGVAAVKLHSSDLRLGDEILIQGKTTGSIRQMLGSMEINNQKIKVAKKGQIIAIKLDKTARVNDLVYKIKSVR